MKRLSITKVLGLIGIMVFVFSYSAIADLTRGISLGYFSPSYGKINQDLAETNEYLGTDFKFKGGLASGVNLGYNFTSNWTITGEFFSFSSKTSDSYEYMRDYGWNNVMFTEIKADLEARLRALIFSGIYKFFPGKPFSPYVGIGIGKFSTEFKQKGRGYSYWSDEPGERYEIYYSVFDDTSSIGFQLLGGAEYEIGERFSVVGEVRYISAEANDLVVSILGETTSLSGGGFKDTNIDWSGLYFGLEVIYFFK